MASYEQVKQSTCLIVRFSVCGMLLCLLLPCINSNLTDWCFVQKVESWDKKYQYLLFAAEPYEIIGFKVCVLNVLLLGFQINWPLYFANNFCCCRYQAQRSTSQQINSSTIGIQTRNSTLWVQYSFSLFII